MPKVDQTDLLLLYFLKRDARMSYSDLGKKLNLSSPAIKYRINNLIEKGVIESFTVTLNQNKLTPSYQSYLLELQVVQLQLEAIFAILQGTQMIQKLYKLASSRNLVGITNPLSTEDVKYLTQVISDLEVQSYSFTPIVEEINSPEPNKVEAENITKLYCPECQDSFLDENGFVELIGDKVMGFCCQKCSNEFKAKLNQIIQ